MTAGLIVLIVDDEDHVLSSFRKAFPADTAPILVYTQNDSKRAVIDAKRIRPDIIVLDLMMGPPDGMEVRALLKADPATQNIPVVYLTGKLADKNDEGPRCGEYMLVKPVAPDDFVEILTRIVSDGS